MEPSKFDEVSFFRDLFNSGARALLIGRRALAFLGLPVLTADYDFWLAIGDIETFNQVAERFQLHATQSPAEARRQGRYVLENDERIDVLVARSLTTIDGRPVEFERLWERRQPVPLDDAEVCLPSIEDLILTKQVVSRPKDLEDIRLLRMLKEPSA